MRRGAFYLGGSVDFILFNFFGTGERILYWSFCFFGRSLKKSLNIKSSQCYKYRTLTPPAGFEKYKKHMELLIL